MWLHRVGKRATLLIDLRVVPAKTNNLTAFPFYVTLFVRETAA